MLTCNGRCESMPDAMVYVIQAVRNDDIPLYLVYPDEGGHHPIFINKHLAAVVAGLFDRNVAADERALERARQGLLAYCRKLNTQVLIDEVTEIYSVSSKLVRRADHTVVSRFFVNETEMFVGYSPAHLPKYYSGDRIYVERELDIALDVEPVEVIRKP